VFGVVVDPAKTHFVSQCHALSLAHPRDTYSRISFQGLLLEPEVVPNHETAAARLPVELVLIVGVLSSLAVLIL
jgi:hypothetical protein